jgi:hypothetical protein
MVDVAKAFMKKNADLIPDGETVLAAVMAEVKGGAWRRGMRQTGALTDAIISFGKNNEAQEGASGDSSAWPEGNTFWVVLTDKQLHVFPGSMGVGKALPGGANYSLEQIAGITVDKKLMISKLTVAFKDGSSVELDLAKQKVKPFIEAAGARFPAP